VRRRKAIFVLWGFQIAAVVVLSLLPGELIPSQPVRGEFEHGAAYLVLALTPSVALGRRKALIAASSMALLGVLLEVLQLKVPGRAFEWADIAGDVLGTAVGAWMGLRIKALFVAGKEAR
jgi:VanZ family protein